MEMEMEVVEVVAVVTFDGNRLEWGAQVTARV